MFQDCCFKTLAYGPEYGAFIPVCSKDGGLGFVGDGCTYAITLQDKNLPALSIAKS
jgi:hypothetical protein